MKQSNAKYIQAQNGSNSLYIISQSNSWSQREPTRWLDALVVSLSFGASRALTASTSRT